jgi:uncharacterized lipoprotein YddW (UPF0748 family)
MFAPLLSCMLTIGMSNAIEPIDSFSYPDAAAARKAWMAQDHTPPVDVARSGDYRPALEMQLPFAAQPDLSRSVIDHKVQLDLAAPGTFELEVAISDTKAAGEVTLYFHSRTGWYGAAAAISSTGWQTLRFSKAAFRIEEKPVGWHQIDTIRLAVWRGQPRDSVLRIRRLSATTSAVALIVPGRLPQEGETRSAQESAHLVAGMFEELGLGADAVDEASLSRGALGARRLAMVAYHPNLSDEGARVLEHFVEQGGKLILCYQLPERLGAALGFGSPQYAREKQPGQFAEMRFTAADVAGLPSAVRQASWNITAAKPVEYHARVAGSWYDAAGKPTTQPALLLSDRGAFFTHIVLGDDREGKKQLLAAIVGHLVPSLWQPMAARALESAQQAGTLHDVKELAHEVETAAVPAAQSPLQKGLARLTSAREQIQQQAYPQAIALARQGHELLVEAYLRSQPSPEREGRAVWNHSGTGAYPGDWERSAAELQAAGFNMVLPNMLWGGLAHYQSDLLPRSGTYRQYGDQIAACVAAAQRHGLEVHVWKVNWNLSTAPKEFVARLRSQGRTMVSVHGEPHDWLCPSHPDNLRLEVDSMLEVARKYPVAGLHFDYIRYSGPEYCYCDGCRQRFEADSKMPVAHWPGDCYSGSRREEYREWRCRQITRLVAAVREETRKIRPELKLSAAVFGSYPACKESVGQDWVQWIRAGYLDFVCPMDYSESDTTFSNLVENQLRLVGGRIPIYPGIGATASSSTLPVDRVAGQIHAARQLGAAGFTIFNFQEGTARGLLPGIGLGVGARPARPPHGTAHAPREE